MPYYTEQEMGELNFSARLTRKKATEEATERAAKICEEMAESAEKTRDDYRHIAAKGGDDYFSGAAHEFSIRADALREAAARIRGEG